MLAVADATAAAVGALYLGSLVNAPGLALWLVVLAPVSILLAKLHGLYDHDHRELRHLTVDEMPQVFVWAIGVVVTMALALTLRPGKLVDISEAARVWLVVSISDLFLRGAARFLWRKVTPPERAIIVGDGPMARATSRKVALFPDVHTVVVAEVPDVENDLEELTALLSPAVDRLIIASDVLDARAVVALVPLCREANVKLNVISPLSDVLGGARLSRLAELPFLDYNTADIPRSTLLLKRAIDIGVSAIALAVLAPLFALIGLVIRLDSRGPVFFRQLRAGKDGRPFRVFKFRTMVADAEDRLGDVVALDELREPVYKPRDDPRVTRVGRPLRRTSLDELPQLINVLKGDMSLVGPRPEMLHMVERYEPEHRFRLSVRPGMTGPMQVFGRGELTFPERLAVERDYIENQSIRRDLRIIGMTASAVIRGTGAF